MIDNCFYYDDLGQKYYSKYDAVKSAQNIYVYFHDNFFMSQNWSKEPETNLKILYKNRAQQIRDQYEYVVLAYSGGIDSTNVLESFYYNHIHIDEILIVGAFKRDSSSGVDENHNGEIYHNCFETLKKLNLFNTKVTICDYSEDMNSYSLIKQDDWYRKIGSYYSFHHWFWYDIHQRYNEDKKIAIVFGIDKPIVGFDKKGKKYYSYLRFLDKCLFQYGFVPNTFNKKVNVERVNFYWSSDSFEIICKQAHIINNFFQNYVQKNETVSYKNFFMHFEKIRDKLIYDVNHKLKFISPKSSSQLISLRDSFTKKQNDFLTLDIFKNYSQGIIKVFEPKFTQEIFTRKYYLEDIK